MPAGRHAKPVEQQIAEGDPKKRGVHVLEQMLAAKPAAEDGYERPAHLTGLAAKMWDHWSDCLRKMRLEKRPDQAALEGACIAYQMAVESDDIIRKEGLFLKKYIKDKKGKAYLNDIKQNPAANTSLKMWSQVRAFCNDFGFTPASRTRIRVQPEDMDSGDGNNNSAEMDLLKALSAGRPERETQPA